MNSSFEFPEFIRAQPEIDMPLPGVRGWMLPGKDTQAVFVEFTENVTVPDHSHEEQWELTLAGEVSYHLSLPNIPSRPILTT